MGTVEGWSDSGSSGGAKGALGGGGVDGVLEGVLPCLKRKRRCLCSRGMTFQVSQREKGSSREWAQRSTRSWFCCFCASLSHTCSGISTQQGPSEGLSSYTCRDSWLYLVGERRALSLLNWSSASSFADVNG